MKLICPDCKYELIEGLHFQKEETNIICRCGKVCIKSIDHERHLYEWE